MNLNLILGYSINELKDMGVENFDIENDNKRFLSLHKIATYSPQLTLTLENRLQKLKSNRHDFKEINEIRTGYSKGNPKGSGIEKQIVIDTDSIYKLGFNCIYNLGVDGISDTLAHLILPELVEYTNNFFSKASQQKGFSTEICTIELYNFKNEKYETVEYETVCNSQGQGTVLIPTCYLIDADEIKLKDKTIKTIFTNEAKKEFLKLYEGKENYKEVEKEISELFLMLRAAHPQNTTYSNLKNRIEEIAKYAKKYPLLMQTINRVAMDNNTMHSTIAAKLCPIK